MSRTSKRWCWPAISQPELTATEAIAEALVRREDLKVAEGLVEEGG